MKNTATKTAKHSTNGVTASERESVPLDSHNRGPVIDPERCRFKLSYGRSTIHRWGVFAEEVIPARRRVIEYTGEKIDADEVLRRNLSEHLYTFWLNDKWALDGAVGGSGAEFINHSCDPNITAYVIRGRIFYNSNRRIEPGEELTVDYNLEDLGEQIACICGAENCRGSITR